jgi:predicted O-methyltransferase YrrM
MAAIAIVSLALAALGCLMGAYLIYKLRQVHETLYGTDYIVRKISHETSQSLQNADLLTYELQLNRPFPTLRGWAASPDILLLVVRHIRQAIPAVIFECGSGASTVAMAQAARLNGCGHVYSIDHDGAFAEQTRGLLASYGLSEWATVTHAPLQDFEINGKRWEWYDPGRLPNTPAIDLLFVDGPPADTPKPLARYPAGPMLFPRLAPDGVVFADDTGRPGEVEVLARWAREFPMLGQRRHFCEKGCHELRAGGWQPKRPIDDGAARPGEAKRSATVSS